MRIAHNSKCTKVKRSQRCSISTVKVFGIAGLFFVSIRELVGGVQLPAVAKKVLVENSLFLSVLNCRYDGNRGIEQHEEKGENFLILERTITRLKLAGGTAPGHKTLVVILPRIG